MDFSKIIVLIPTLNEAKNLSILIPELFRRLPGISVLIVDDRSTDGTAPLLAELQRTFPRLSYIIRQGEKGYGRACLEGFRRSQARPFEAIVTMDADFSHDFNAIPGLAAHLPEYDVVIGSRYIPGGAIANWHRHRRLLSRFANWYVGFILQMPIRDVTTGFNAYAASALRTIDLNGIAADGYAFLVELKYRLRQKRCRFVEHPITFSERREGQSKMSSRVIWESIWLPWKLRLY